MPTRRKPAAPGKRQIARMTLDVTILFHLTGVSKTIRDLVIATGRHENTVMDSLKRLAAAGMVVFRYTGVGKGHRLKHWWRTIDAPADAPKRPRLSQPPTRRLLADVEAIVPPDIVVQVCPGFGGQHRHTFTPPNGWVGQITKDSAARRASGHALT